VLRRLTLNLARSPGFPEGSRRHGYVIVAPLDSEDRLDVKAYQNARDLCVVHRFWDGEPDRTGKLVHRAGGAEGASWMIDYDPETSDDDERAFRLGAHKLAHGEYVSIADDDGETHTFRIVESVPA
jgi:hypothetical protein